MREHVVDDVDGTPFVAVEGIEKSYGDTKVLRSVSFDVAKGEMLVLLGPSGCGKTTLLSVVAGLVGPNAGSIRVDGRDVTRVPAHRRDMPVVFQDYALFPHMKVRDNVAFGLSQRRVAKSERQARVDRVLELVEMAHLGGRYPRELSGGQQQRVALARSLVVEPTVLLLDEPLSNLDAQLRVTMRDELGEILRAAGTTSILVTHDQEEGLAIADKVLLLREGVIEQGGTPEEVYRRPRSTFAAKFLGVANLLSGTVHDNHGEVATVMTAFGPVTAARADAFAPGTEAVVAVRPDRLRLASDGAEAGNAVKGTVSGVSYLGRHHRVRLTTSAEPLVVDAPVDMPVARGDEFSVTWEPGDAYLVSP